MVRKGILAMKIAIRLSKRGALALTVAGLAFVTPAGAEERGFLPLFSESAIALPAGQDARFGLFLRGSPAQDPQRVGHRANGELSTIGRVAFAARLTNRPVAAHIGLSDFSRRDRDRGLQDLPLALGVEYGDFERFLFSGEVVLPTRLNSGEVRGGISSSSVRVNASFRF